MNWLRRITVAPKLIRAPVIITSSIIYGRGHSAITKAGETPETIFDN